MTKHNRNKEATMNIELFLHHLRACHAPLVFNPWSEYDPTCDVGQEAPLIRSANLRRYLELRRNARYLFVAEALGYQGGHFTGIAITSERILLGLHPNVRPHDVLGAWTYRRTSNPDCALLNASQKRQGLNEPTDTVVWSVITGHGLQACDVILWNIFPFHPYKEGCLLSNRTPTGAELEQGVAYTRMLLELVPGMQVLAIGQKAAQTLNRFNVACRAVPHPSMGGANRFRAAAAAIFGAER